MTAAGSSPSSTSVSADYQRLFTEFGITAEAVAQAAKDSIAAADAAH